MRSGFGMSVINALAMAGASLLGMGDDVFQVRPVERPTRRSSSRRTAYYSRGYHFTPQSKESKDFYLDRAKAKRFRKGIINRGRVICGEMESVGGVKIKGAKLYIGDELITKTEFTMSPEAYAAMSDTSATMTVDYLVTDDGNYTEPNGKDLSKAKLIEIAAQRGVKVFPSWTRQAIVEALNAAH